MGLPVLTMSSAEHEGERLQKVLSAAGVASRRQVEAFITAGRIRVNGEIVTELGRRVVAASDVVELDGQVLELDSAKRYLLFHKPTGMVTSLRDDRGRRDLSEILQELGERVFPVGRLDYDTSGLLILTNDGDIAHVLAHPSFEIPKTYLATVSGQVGSKALSALGRGVELEDGVVAADSVRRVGTPGPAQSIVEITLHSGKNRVVRRMCEAVGHPVLALQRRQFGPFHLEGLKPGHYRDFSEKQRHQLATLVADARALVAGGRNS